VGCITTPGETIDAVVTEAGVAVHPRREDLREHLSSGRWPAAESTRIDVAGWPMLVDSPKEARTTYA
jgi:citrate lyase alpha subunit